MARPIVNYALDWFAFAVISLLSSTGLLLKFGLPRGSSLFGLTKHVWNDIHFWTGVTFMVVVTIHLLLHAGWIKAMTLGKTKDYPRTRRAIFAISVAVICVSIIISLPILGSMLKSENQRGAGQGPPEGRGPNSP